MHGLFCLDSNPAALPAALRTNAHDLRTYFEKSQYRTISLCLFGTLLQSLLLLPVPLLQCWVIDRLVAMAKNQPVSAADEADALMVIGAALGGTIVCFMLRTILAWKGSAAMSRVSLEVVRTLTEVLHRKFQRLPVSYFDRAQTGQLMARITSDVGTLLIFLTSASRPAIPPFLNWMTTEPLGLLPCRKSHRAPNSSWGISILIPSGETTRYCCAPD